MTAIISNFKQYLNQLIKAFGLTWKLHAGVLEKVGIKLRREVDLQK